MLLPYSITLQVVPNRIMMSQKRRLQINSCFQIIMFAAHCNLGFTICSSYHIEQVWPPLHYTIL